MSTVPESGDDRPQAVHDGQRYRTVEGIHAVKGGLRPNASNHLADAEPKPPWLRVRVPGGEGYTRVRQIVREHSLHTVCAE